jgi:hypothetical protein
MRYRIKNFNELWFIEILKTIHISKHNNLYIHNSDVINKTKEGSI